MMRTLVLTELTVVQRRRGLLSQMLKTVPSAMSHTTKHLVGVIVFASPISFSSTETFAIFSRTTIIGPDGTKLRQLWKCQHLLHATACCDKFLRRQRSCSSPNRFVGLPSVLSCGAFPAKTLLSFPLHWSIELAAVELIGSPFLGTTLLTSPALYLHSPTPSPSSLVSTPQ